MQQKNILLWLIVTPLLFLAIVTNYYAFKKADIKPSIKTFTEPLLSSEKKEKYLQEINKHKSAIQDRIIEGEIDGVKYELESGPPVRAVFKEGIGILDNWSGIVYDPSNEIGILKGIEGNWDKLRDPALEKYVKLFGGDMYQCKMIEKDWYECKFT